MVVMRVAVAAAILLVLPTLLADEPPSSNEEKSGGLWGWQASEKYWELHGLAGRDPDRMGDDWTPPPWFVDVSQNDDRFKCSDIRSNLKDIFVNTLFFAPKVIVELGVRFGCSSFAFEGAASLVGAKLYGFDLDPVSSPIGQAVREMYQRLEKQQRGRFTKHDSLLAVQDWHLISGGAKIDVLFIDTSHTYDHTLSELGAWEPHLSERAMILLHDSNIPLEPRQHKDGRMILGEADNGVAWAIHDFTLTCWNPDAWYDSGSLSTPFGWRITHDPTGNGMTMLVRQRRIVKEQADPSLLDKTCNHTWNERASRVLIRLSAPQDGGEIIGHSIQEPRDGSACDSCLDRRKPDDQLLQVQVQGAWRRGVRLDVDGVELARLPAHSPESDVHDFYLGLWTPGIHRIQAFWIDEGGGETEEEGSSTFELAEEISFFVEDKCRMDDSGCRV